MIALAQEISHTGNLKTIIVSERKKRMEKKLLDASRPNAPGHGDDDSVCGGGRTVMVCNGGRWMRPGLETFGVVVARSFI